MRLNGPCYFSSSLKADSRTWQILVVVGIVLLLWGATGPRAAAHNGPEPHSLTALVDLPDQGLTAGEQLCLALYPGGEETQEEPIDVGCLTAGEFTVRFEGLEHGPYRLAAPAAGSTEATSRYEGQVVVTEVPADPETAAFMVEVRLGPEAGIRQPSGQISITASMCPAGLDTPPATSGGWAQACPEPAAGVRFVLAGRGNGVGVQTVVTGRDDVRGRARFDSLPPGTYELVEVVPSNVADVIWYATSSLTGRTLQIEPDEELTLAESETLSLAAYNLPRPNVLSSGTGGSDGAAGQVTTSGEIGSEANPGETPAPQFPTWPSRILSTLVILTSVVAAVVALRWQVHRTIGTGREPGDPNGTTLWKHRLGFRRK